MKPELSDKEGNTWQRSLTLLSAQISEIALTLLILPDPFLSDEQTLHNLSVNNQALFPFKFLHLDIRY